MRRYLCIVLIMYTALLTGCAKPADHNAMTVTREDIPVSTSSKSKFHKKLIINSVIGGKETNPILFSTVSNDKFRMALHDSLKSFNYITDQEHAQYDLYAQILDVKHPTAFGITFTTTSVIRYQIVEIKNKKLVFNDKIESTYSAKFSDAFYGATRLRMAIEGSIRNNIKAFLQKLESTTS